jgi:hypothetical protein
MGSPLTMTTTVCARAAEAQPNAAIAAKQAAASSRR